MSQFNQYMNMRPSIPHVPQVYQHQSIPYFYIYSNEYNVYESPQSMYSFPIQYEQDFYPGENYQEQRDKVSNTSDNGKFQEKETRKKTQIEINNQPDKSLSDDSNDSNSPQSKKRSKSVGHGRRLDYKIVGSNRPRIKHRTEKHDFSKERSKYKDKISFTLGTIKENETDDIQRLKEDTDSVYTYQRVSKKLDELVNKKYSNKSKRKSWSGVTYKYNPLF